MKKSGMIFGTIGFLVIFAVLFLLVTRVLQDKRIEGEYNPTTKIRGFYAEGKNSLDFVFVGSSQLYADIAPAVLFQDYGMTAYDFAANEQPLWISYYYIKEALERQNPKAVLLDVFAVYGADYEEEGVNHINLDDLPFSLNKINAIRDSVPRELRYSYYFTIAKYHTTWEGLDAKKFNASFAYGKDVMKGYSPFCAAADYERTAKESVVNEKECGEIPARAREWLYRIIELTRKEGVDLILIKTPNGSAERQKLYNSVELIAKEEGVPFVNMNTVFDGEAHINVLQAKKVTDYIGAYLAERYTIEDKRENASFADWEQSVAYFERYYNKCGLVSIADGADYAGFLAEQTDYVVLLGALYDGQGGEKSRLEAAKLMPSLGLADGMQEKKGLVAIVEDGTVLKQKSGDKKLSVSAKSEETGLKVKISAAENGEKELLFKAGTAEYSFGGQGLYIVVYDKLLKEVVDIVLIGEGNVIDRQ